MRYGAKGIFKFETTFTDPARPKSTFYETRILNFEAANDEEAAKKACELFTEDSWRAYRPIADIVVQEQTFIGLSQVKDLAPLDGHEVWYEYTDDCPPLLPTQTPGA